MKKLNVNVSPLKVEINCTMLHKMTKSLTRKPKG